MAPDGDGGGGDSGTLGGGEGGDPLGAAPPGMESEGTAEDAAAVDNSSFGPGDDAFGGYGSWGGLESETAPDDDTASQNPFSPAYTDDPAFGFNDLSPSTQNALNSYNNSIKNAFAGLLGIDRSLTVNPVTGMVDINAVANISPIGLGLGFVAPGLGLAAGKAANAFGISDPFGFSIDLGYEGDIDATSNVANQGNEGSDGGYSPPRDPSNMMAQQAVAASAAPPPSLFQPQQPQQQPWRPNMWSGNNFIMPRIG